MSSQLLVAKLFKIMNNETENKPWLYCEGTEENQPLVGNREGFEILRNSISLLLAGDGDRVPLNEEDLGFGELLLQEHPDPIEPASVRCQLIMILIVSLFASVPLFALYGLYSLISKLF